MTKNNFAMSDGWKVIPNPGMGITRVALLISDPIANVRINNPIDIQRNI
jgi:hypothetical protein